MQFDGDASTEVRRKPEPAASGTKPSTLAAGEPLWRTEGARRSPLARALIGAAVVLLAGLLAYALLAPGDDGTAWTPPPGLSREDTPPWLQTLCAKNTPELCTLADHARNPSDCENLQKTLRALQALEQTLVARAAITQPQRWVLLELYGQGRELCQLDPAGQANH